MLNWLVNHGIGIGLMFTPAIAGLVTWLLAKLTGWLRTKTDNQIIWDFFDFIEINAPTVIKEQEQIFKAMISEAKLPHSDGGRDITAAEKRAARQACIDQLKLFCGRKYSKAMKVMKLGEIDMDKIIGAKVEEAIYDANNNH